MISSRQKNLPSNVRRVKASKKYLRSNIESETFYLNLQEGNYVPMDRLQKGMTYRILVNGGTSFYETTALCTEVRRFSDEVLYAKFNFKGGSALIRGNYELIYYCQSIIH